MTPFLVQVATLLYDKLGPSIQRTAFVFPNRRSGLFFRKYLSEAAGRPIFAPATLTIAELFQQLAGCQPADRLQLLFILYRIYQKHSGSHETFDDFVYWGEMLLNDFDDVDKYLVDARALFTNIRDLHEIEQTFSYLEPRQIEAIRAFWSSFRPENNPTRRSFLEMWRILYPIYTDLRAELTAIGKGYEGMIARRTVEQLHRTDTIELPYERIVFVGLNALTAVERELMRWLQKNELADFYWDYAAPWVTDADNRASSFVRANLDRFPARYPLPEEPFTAPQVEVVGIPSQVGQTKYVHTLLTDVIRQHGELSAADALRTAIVLPDEQLLMPLMNSIPAAIERINVTVGYPLSGTPVSALMEAMLTLQKNLRRTEGQLSFYHRDVAAILNHPYIRTHAAHEAVELIRTIAVENKIRLRPDELYRTPLLTAIFTPAISTEQLIDVLLQVLEMLGKLIADTADEAAPDDDHPVTTDQLDREFIFRYHALVNRMKSLMADGRTPMMPETFVYLLKRLVDTISIPFQGEPLAGLQVMGVLETRLLDFDRVIILSVNEGVFPAKRAASSFIPHTLRYGFRLPTAEHQDSIAAYHFYRLISRAQHVHLIYDTRAEGLKSGEASRFIHQLRYHYELPIRHRLVVYDVAAARQPMLRVPKDAAVMAKMAAYADGGGKAISASLINTWLDCPLKFYFIAIEEMKDDDEVAEYVENRIFGNLLHKVMELIYRPLCNAQVTADLLTRVADEKILTPAIRQAFAELFFHSDDIRPLAGQNFLTGEMIRKYVLKILEHDRKMTPFRYVRSEMRMTASIALHDGRQIALKGFIDRLDEVAGHLRVVDYKTGVLKPLRFDRLPALFDPADPQRQPAVMQVSMYAWMLKQHVDDNRPIQPVIYYLRSLFSDQFDPTIKIGREATVVDDFALLHEPFEMALRDCLTHIFDPQKPFVQTADVRVCSYCPFAGLCGR